MNPRVIRIAILLVFGVALFAFNLRFARPIEIWPPLVKLAVGVLIAVPTARLLKLL